MKNFVAQLDTPGGHCIVCFALLFVGAIFWKLGVPKGDDIVVFSLGVLGRSMVGQNGKGAGISTPEEKNAPGK